MHPAVSRKISADFHDENRRHGARSDHHPEHFAMPFESRMHLTCALLGSVAALAKKYGIDADVAWCRAHLEGFPKKYPEWRKHAVTERLPAPADRVFGLPDERVGRVYSWRELEKVLGDPWISELTSVREYADDVMREKFAVLKVWREIAEKHDDRFAAIAERVQDHDLDRFRPDSVRAGALYFSQWTDEGLPSDHPLRTGAGFDAPGVPDPPRVPEQPDVKSEAPEIPEQPDVKSEAPGVPEQPDVKSEAPGVPEQPDVKSEAPEIPEQPDDDLEKEGPESPEQPDDDLEKEGPAGRDVKSEVEGGPDVKPERRGPTRPDEKPER